MEDSTNPAASHDLVRNRIIRNVQVQTDDYYNVLSSRLDFPALLTGNVLVVAETVPSEISLEWVYLPPLLVTVVLGYLAAFGITRLLNATRLSRYFWRPEIGFLAFWVLFTSLIGLWFLPP